MWLCTSGTPPCTSHFHSVSLNKSANMDSVFWLLHLLIILLSVVFTQGIKVATPTQQVNVAVKVGDEACLQCPLSYSTDVLQVMWQKILPKEEVTLASCHRNRNKLNPEFTSKIGLRGTRLRNCSIQVQNVTEQDEGCYLCLFIMSSDVAYTGKACLQVYELQEPVLNSTTSISTDELVVSCSVTGRPAPDVTLHVQHHPTIRTQTSTVSNSNGTVTVVRTAALSPPHINKTLELMCSARSPFGHERKSLTITDFKHVGSSPSENYSTLAWSIVLLVVLLLCVVAVVWLCAPKCQKKSDDAEDNMNIDKKVLHGGFTPLKPSVRDENETKWTPMTGQKLSAAFSPQSTSENLRKRTPVSVRKTSPISPRQLPTPRELFPETY